MNRLCLLSFAFLLVFPSRLFSDAVGFWRNNALVIGCDYGGGTAAPLPGNLKDAERVATLLRGQFGFGVTLLKNPSRHELEEALNVFQEKLKQGKGVGLFYFSGHGARLENRDFILAGAGGDSLEDLASDMLEIHDIARRMEAAGNRTNLLFFDSDRSALQVRGVPLGDEKSPQGVLIGFATAPGSKALAGTDGSPYTNALLRHLPTPGLGVHQILVRVHADVRSLPEIRGLPKQCPCLESGLIEEFFFVPAATALAPRQKDGPPEAAGTPP